MSEQQHSAEKDVPPCEVHVPGRDEPSPWCAACRMSGATAEQDVTLTEAERDALWEAIERAFLDTTTWNREVENEIDRTVERIIAGRTRVSPPAACPDCGHQHTPNGCTGDPTSSDLWAGVSPAACDCDTVIPPGSTPAGDVR